MLAYLVRRIVFGAAVLIGTSIITFAIAFVVPADPAVAMAGAKADPQTLASIRSELGLDQPLYVQYARYLDRAIHGDLGRSYIRRESGVADPRNRDGRDRRRVSRARGRQPAPRHFASAGLDSGVLAGHDASDRRSRNHSLFSVWRLQRCDQ